MSSRSSLYVVSAFSVGVEDFGPASRPACCPHPTRPDMDCHLCSQKHDIVLHLHLVFRLRLRAVKVICGLRYQEKHEGSGLRLSGVVTTVSTRMWRNYAWRSSDVWERGYLHPHP